MLSDNQKEQLRDTMEREIDSLRWLIDGLKERTEPEEDDLEMAHSGNSVSKMIAQAELQAAMSKLGKLEHNRNRLMKGDFDLCPGCGAPIPFDRFLAAPESRLCIQCAKHAV